MLCLCLTLGCCANTVELLNDGSQVQYVMDGNSNRISVAEKVPQLILNIQNSSMMNMYNSSNGGSVYFSSTYWEHPMIKINTSVFRNSSVNLANGMGGSVYLVKVNETNIDNSEFTSCSAYTGGAIYVNNSKYLFVKGSRFSNCSSKFYGGALYGGYIDTVVMISYCVFESCSSYYNGGVIFLDIYLGRTWIEDSSFYNCSTDNYGCMYLYSRTNNSEIDINRVCSYKTRANYSAFVRGLFSDNSLCTFNLLYSSIVSTSVFMGEGDGNVRIGGGRCNLKYINWSNNNFKNAGFDINPTRDSYVEYNTIYNNSSPSYAILTLYSPDTAIDSLMKLCNVISNYLEKKENAALVLLYGYSNTKGTKVENCIFYGNNGILFYTSTGKHFVYGCHIVHNALYQIYNSSSIGYFTTSAVIVDIHATNTYAISHLSSYYCSTYDIQGQDLSPCQTLYPVPSTCIFSGDNSIIVLAKVFEILQLSILSSIILLL